MSVVIPHYNYGQYLPLCLSSVLDQEGVDLEVIVVDDCSTDGSREIARTLTATDPRVTLVEHETNARHIATFNDGLSRATGEYIVLISADDALAPGSLARAAALMEHDPDVGLVYGRVEQFTDVPPAPRTRRSWWTIWGGEQWLRMVVRRGRNVPLSPEVVMRRSTYEEIGGYDPAMPHTSDMLMWLRAAARSKVGRVNGPSHAYYRVHGENMHLTEFGGILDDFRESRATFDRFFMLDGDVVRSRRLSARSARAAVAREAVLASTRAPATAQGEERRALLLAFASQTDPRIVHSPSWLWAQVARPDARLSAPGLVERVESWRWTMRNVRFSRLGR